MASYVDFESEVKTVKQDLSIPTVWGAGGSRQNTLQCALIFLSL